MAPESSTRHVAPNSTQQEHENRGTDDHSNGEDGNADDPASDKATYWRDACAAIPPMTTEQIASVGAIVRRIDQRRLR